MTARRTRTTGLAALGAALLVPASLGLATTSPAAAAPVDRATFSTQTEAAATAAMTRLPGRAVTLTMTLTDGSTSAVETRVDNPDGTSLETQTVNGATTSTTRCTAAGRCFTKAAGARKWHRDPTVTDRHVETTFTPGSLIGGIPETSTYDITDGTYTATTPPGPDNTDTVTTTFAFTTHTLTVTVTAGQSVTAVVNTDADPIPVRAPARKQILR